LGGRGSGGKRVGAGRKKQSDLERAIGGNAGKRGVVLQHPSTAAASSSTAVAPIVTFDAPAELQVSPEQLAALRADLAFLREGSDPQNPNPQIAEVQGQIDVLTTAAQGLTVWAELAPHAFAARTLTAGTAAAFVMLCRAIVKERALSASVSGGGPNHRGLMARIGTWLKDFELAPFGKPMYTAEPEAKVNPLDRFTKGRA